MKVFHTLLIYLFFFLLDLGNKPCNAFSNLATAEFAEKFLGTMKVPSDLKSLFMKHLALIVNS